MDLVQSQLQSPDFNVGMMLTCLILPNQTMRKLTSWLANPLRRPLRRPLLPHIASIGTRRAWVLWARFLRDPEITAARFSVMMSSNGREVAHRWAQLELLRRPFTETATKRGRHHSPQHWTDVKLGMEGRARIWAYRPFRQFNRGPRNRWILLVALPVVTEAPPNLSSHLST